MFRKRSYQHQTINHSKNFVDPKNENVHTQNVESQRNVIKRKLKRKGKKVRKYLDENLLEYVYKNEKPQKRKTFFEIFS